MLMNFYNSKGNLPFQKLEVVSCNCIAPK